MIVKAVWLHNIRSYRDQVIVFPEGKVTVIYGDVGTGKTTILNAISFAIFGQPAGAPSRDPFSRFESPSASDLLRRGCRSGFIQLWVRLGDRDVFIRRIVEAEGGRVRDRGGLLRVINRREGRDEVPLRRLSAQELRARVLEVLGIPEERGTRAKSRVFVSAIYVPQFGVFNVLTASDEERQEIVNRVFNLMRYTLARKRASLLRRALREEVKGGRWRKGLEQRVTELEEEVRRLEERARELEELKARLRAEEARRERLLGELDEARRRREEAERLVEEARRRRDEVLGRRSTYLSLLEELKRRAEALKRLGVDLGRGVKAQLAEAGERRSRLEEEASRLQGEVERLQGELRRVEEEASRLEDERRGLERRLRELRGEASRVEGLINAKLAELERIAELEAKGLCPVCRQPVRHEHAERLKREVEDELGKLKEALEGRRRELDEAQRRLDELEARLRELRDARGGMLAKLTSIQLRLGEVRDELVKASERVARLRECQRAIEELRELERRVGELEGVEEEYARAERELREAEARLDELSRLERRLLEELGRVERGIGELKGRIDEVEREVAKLEELRGELEELKARLRTLKACLEFAEKYVDKIIEGVERYVRGEAYRVFVREFTRIFSTLMEGYSNLEVEVTPDLVPRLKAYVDGQLVEITAPSGGQVASISLAYRLALNSVARAMIPQLRDGLLILDEPTYGFSPERIQLLKRVLYRRAGPRQIIVVTHDRSLYEEEAENVVRIRLELDTDTTTTRVHYMGVDESYLKRVEKLMREVMTCRARPLVAATGFTPQVREARQEPGRPSRGGRRNRGILDYFAS